MRIDYEFIEQILEVFLNSDSPIVNWQNFDDLDSDKFVFHMEIMADKNLVVGINITGDLCLRNFSKGYPDGYNIILVDWRLTADGHDFAAALTKPDILLTIKDKFRKEGLSAVIDVSKKIASKQVLKLLDE
ncbi:DUF2513 domain-containing protein [Colwellia psychrerythraea]|uniref:DUF2513 domain-containing protein n=1 Tax=Colwellia psychrerythraea (strain 34H / ATCC BAA-681) TaxID=167879 RepID=Q487X0_COLP3|nr:DUF2513 domain-containing protein [Colwellia psychrerythraea]AAZ27648.1 hypothetical protein CPS_0896 [Colwellia psychrerythraea 34H]